MKLRVGATREKGEHPIPVPIGEVVKIEASVVYKGSFQPDRITIEHDQDLNEIRIIVNEECVWSTMESEETAA